MYMIVFKCTSIILFIFTILINFTMEIVSIKHNSKCVSFILLLNCQNGLVFVNFNLTILLRCCSSHFISFP